MNFDTFRRSLEQEIARQNAQLETVRRALGTCDPGLVFQVDNAMLPRASTAPAIPCQGVRA